MPSLDAHMKECVNKLGNPFKEVNLWLDEFAKFGLFIHRAYRHNKEGIEEVRKMWGDSAAMAAELHVLADCKNIPTRKDYEEGRVNTYGEFCGRIR